MKKGHAPITLKILWFFQKVAKSSNCEETLASGFGYDYQWKQRISLPESHTDVGGWSKVALYKNDWILKL